ncbi:MAG TPA: hypothetical protein VMU84_03085, partial [Thermoanaerobaculia bacterium]|nr:hypothetical protein [Thermoanaerobaculia bacterium]
AAGVLFTIIAFVNFATAFFSGLTLVVAAAAFGMSVSSVAMLLLGMSPGLVKTFVRLVPFLRSGALRGLVTTQVDVVRPSARRRAFPAITAGVIYYAILFAIALLLTARAPIAPAVAIIGGVAFIAYGLAQSAISLNDPQSFRMWHLSLLVSFVALRPSWPGVLGIVLLAYMDAGYAGMPPIGRDLVMRSGVLATLSAYGRDALAFGRHFPALAPVARDVIEPVIDQLFGEIPGESRIIFEATGDRAVGGYRAFLVVCDEILPQRGIELLPDEYVRLTLRFYERAHGVFHGASSHEALAHAIETVGASHAIAHTSALADALRAIGCEELDRLRVSELTTEIASLLRLPPADLVLFRAAGSTITPRAMFTMRPNAITWPAAAGQTYTVRYRHHEELEASQGAQKLVVRAQRVDDTDLEITTVDSVTDEPITLRFVARML